MATINYKEKYEKAVHAAMLAKQDTESAVTIRILEEIFPELKESEDEKIRKEIMRFIFDYPQKLTNRDSWLTWLEKQGEQKPAWSEEDEEIWEEISDMLWEGYKQSRSKFSWDDIRNWLNPKLKSLRPQNRWKPSDEQMDALDDVISSRDIKYDVLSELWEDLKKLKENKL